MDKHSRDHYSECRSPEARRPGLLEPGLLPVVCLPPDIIMPEETYLGYQNDTYLNKVFFFFYQLSSLILQ